MKKLQKFTSAESEHGSPQQAREENNKQYLLELP